MYEVLTKPIIDLQSEETGIPLSKYKAIKILPNSYQIKEVGKMAALPTFKFLWANTYPEEVNREFNFQVIEIEPKGATVHCWFERWVLGFLVSFTLDEAQNVTEFDLQFHHSQIPQEILQYFPNAFGFGVAPLKKPKSRLID